MGAMVQMLISVAPPTPPMASAFTPPYVSSTEGLRKSLSPIQGSTLASCGAQAFRKSESDSRSSVIAPALLSRVDGASQLKHLA